MPRSIGEHGRFGVRYRNSAACHGIQRSNKIAGSLFGLFAPPNPLGIVEVPCHGTARSIHIAGYYAIQKPAMGAQSRIGNLKAVKGRCTDILQYISKRMIHSEEKRIVGNLRNGIVERKVRLACTDEISRLELLTVTVANRSQSLNCLGIPVLRGQRCSLDFKWNAHLVNLDVINFAMAAYHEPHGLHGTQTRFHADLNAPSSGDGYKAMSGERPYGLADYRS
jgi:hypothetical protein